MPQSLTPNSKAGVTSNSLRSASSCRSLFNQEDDQLKVVQAAEAERQQQSGSASRLAASASASTVTRPPVSTGTSAMCIPGRVTTSPATSISGEAKPRLPATGSASQSPTLVKRPVITVTDKQQSELYEQIEEASVGSSHW